MSKSYSKSKGRKDSNGQFFGIPKIVLNHPNFIKVSAHGVKLLLDLGTQYKGYNNGDLCATWSMMHERGWRSKDTLNSALRELEHFGLITIVQIGGLNRPSLYALTWRPIDKPSKDTAWKKGDNPGIWKEHKAKFIKPSTESRKARQKKQERLLGQSGTVIGLVQSKREANR